MKITKKNVTHANPEWKGVCNACKSVAIAFESELHAIQMSTLDGRRFSWEKCLVCNAGPFGGMIFYKRNNDYAVFECVDDDDWVQVTVWLEKDEAFRYLGIKRELDENRNFNILMRCDE